LIQPDFKHVNFIARFLGNLQRFVEDGCCRRRLARALVRAARGAANNELVWDDPSGTFVFKHLQCCVKDAFFPVEPRVLPIKLKSVTPGDMRAHRTLPRCRAPTLTGKTCGSTGKNERILDAALEDAERQMFPRDHPNKFVVCGSSGSSN